MRTTSKTRLWIIGLLLFLITGLYFQLAAREANAQREGHSSQPQQAVAQGERARAASPLWRSFLWESMPPEWLRDSKQNILLEAYQKSEWHPFFITARFDVSQAGQALLQRLDHLESEAIDPRPFQLEALRAGVQNLHRQKAALKAADPNYSDAPAEFQDSASLEAGSTRGKAQSAGDAAASKDKEQRYREVFRTASEIDLKLANALVRYAQEMNPFSGEEQVKVLAGEIPMQEFLSSLEPRPAQYKALVKALHRYRQLAAQGGQMLLRDSATMRPGESGESVRNLQKRLQQEDFYSGKLTGTFDAATREAVMHFQSAHTIPPDATVGQKTREWLNTPFRDKADMIAEGLRLMRQSQTRRFDRYVRINIPQFALEYYKDGKVKETHRVIVGKAGGKKVKARGRMIGENQTPPITSAIEQIVFNPRWYVSPRIRKELASEIAADPGYFAKHGYVQMASLDATGQPRIFQMPGPKNALGRIKFEFPNVHAVFLHDTPNKGLFQRTRRDFSHGCVRVDKASELALSILKDDKNPAAEKAETYLSTTRPSHVRLSQPVPIVIEYVPVTIGEAGHPVFIGDPYGLLKDEQG
ncbi:MAG: L,D-transpeptidase family protein [Syntrophobacteraceae bacterium]